jgi:aminoglycoside 6'-N-acetyltransferase I
MGKAQEPNQKPDQQAYLLAFIAEVEGKVIGFIELSIRNYAEGSRKPEVPYIEAWCIHPEFYGKGYGK